MSVVTPYEEWYQYRGILAERRRVLNDLIVNLDRNLTAFFEQYPNDPLTGEPPISVQRTDSGLLIRSVTGDEQRLEPDLIANAVRITPGFRLPAGTSVKKVHSITAAHVGGAEPSVVVQQKEQPEPEPPQQTAISLTAFHRGIGSALLSQKLPS